MIEARFDGLDQTLRDQQREIFFERFVESARPLHMLGDAFLAIQNLLVMRRQRFQQIMQIGVPHIESARLGRWRHHDRVLVAVAARLDLIRRREQFHEDLKVAALDAGSLLPQVKIRLQHGIAHGRMIPRDELVDGGLRPPPQIFDVGLFIEGRQ